MGREQKSSALIELHVLMKIPNYKSQINNPPKAEPKFKIKNTDMILKKERSNLLKL